MGPLIELSNFLSNQRAGNNLNFFRSLRLEIDTSTYASLVEFFFFFFFF